MNWPDGSFPEPTSFNGDDERDYSGSGRSIEQSFWQSFEFAKRNHCVWEFLRIYRPVPKFAELVAEADKRLAGLRKDVA